MSQGLVTCIVGKTKKQKKFYDLIFCRTFWYSSLIVLPACLPCHCKDDYLCCWVVMLSCLPSVLDQPEQYVEIKGTTSVFMWQSVGGNLDCYSSWCCGSVYSRTFIPRLEDWGEIMVGGHTAAVTLYTMHL